MKRDLIQPRSYGLRQFGLIKVFPGETDFVLYAHTKVPTYI